MAKNNERFVMAEVGSGEELVAGMLNCMPYYGTTREEHVAHVDKMVSWLDRAYERNDGLLLKAYATELVGAALLAGFALFRDTKSFSRSRNVVVIKDTSLFMTERLFSEFRDAIGARAGEMGLIDRRPS